MKKLILCLILASLSGSALASGRIDIPVTQPPIKPQKGGSVSLAILRQNIFFNISCTVESTIPDTYLAWGLEGSGLKFENLIANGKVVDTQIKLPKGDSTLEIRRFWYSSADASITILNLDYSGALTIKQCHADPVVSN